MESFRVIWTEEAWKDLQHIVLHVRIDSEVAAQKVKLGILEAVFSLSYLPKRHPVYLTGREGAEYRFLRKWNYRIIYRLSELNVFVFRIMHTRQKPLSIS